jgi:ribosomal protein L7Ae-like RNA K-turn-binding protein
MIGLARRAGLAVGGFEKVYGAVPTGTVGLLLLALDGAEGGRRKVGALASGLPVAIVLTATEMGSIFGRERVVNIAIRSGRLCDRLVALVEKIAGFRAGAVVDSRMGPAPGRPARQNGGIGSR